MNSHSQSEHELWLRYFRNDTEAQVELIKRYQGLVAVTASGVKRHLPSHILLDDLIAAGQEGLWNAMKSFRLENGVQFASYASMRIRGAILDELRRTSPYSRTQLAQIQKAKAAYGAHQSVVDTHVSLDADERFEWIVDDSAVSPEEAVIKSEQINELNRTLIKLTDQEQLILSLVFVEGLNLTETAEVLSLSRSRVSSVYTTALKRLKGSLLKTKRV